MRGVHRRRPVGVPEGMHVTPALSEGGLDLLHHSIGECDSLDVRARGLELHVQSRHGVTFLLLEPHARERVASNGQIHHDVHERHGLVLGTLPSEHGRARVGLALAGCVSAIAAVSVATKGSRFGRVTLRDLLVAILGADVESDAELDETISPPRVEPRLHQHKRVTVVHVPLL